MAEKAIAGNPEMADLEVRFDGRMVIRDEVPLGAVVIIGMDPVELEDLDREVLPTGVEIGPDVSLTKVSRRAPRCTRSSFRKGEQPCSWIPKTGSWSQWPLATWRACRTSRRNWPRPTSKSPAPQSIASVCTSEV